MTPNPTISFIVPCYNVGIYLPDAIESILLQKIDKEIILVDDGSTDQTLVIAYRYAKQYPFVTLVHNHNRGAAFARNQGLALARGEFVMFLDSDDLLNGELPFARLCDLAKERKADVINGRYMSCAINNPADVRHWPTIFDETKGDQFTQCKLQYYFTQKILRHWHPMLGTLILRRQFLVDNQLQFLPALRLSEDGLFWIDMLTSDGSIIEVDIEFIQYRLRPNSLTHSEITETNMQSWVLFIEILKSRINVCQDNVLRDNLQGVLAIEYWQFHQDALRKAPPELVEKYKGYITPDIIQFYESRNLRMV